MFKSLFGSKEKPTERLAINIDPQKPYLSGLLVRFDETHAEALAFFRRVNPGFMPPEFPAKLSLSQKAGIAALGLSLGVAFEAMMAHDMLMIDGDDASMREGAIGISYAMFLFVLFSGQVKLDGVVPDRRSVPERFAAQFIYLDAVQRKALAEKGEDVFKQIIESDNKEFTDWLQFLTTTVELWLFSATSSKRTEKEDMTLRSVLVFQLKALFDVVEQINRAEKGT